MRVYQLKMERISIQSFGTEQTTEFIGIRYEFSLAIAIKQLLMSKLIVCSQSISGPHGNR